MNYKNLIAFVLPIFILACKKEKTFKVNGYVPIYANYSDTSVLAYNESPRDIRKTGTIVSYNNYLFINDIGLGIHVLDYSKPDSVVQVTFINISGNASFSIRNNILYADNGKDLLAIDISDILNIKIIDVEFNALIPTTSRPTNFNVYYECVDPSKGIVVGWEWKELINPKCKTN